MVRLVALALLLLGARPAAADSDPDTEMAQQLFNEGAAAYSAHDYARALDRFSAARRMKPLAAFDYNIARCHDRLGHAADAVAAYERYLAQEPSAPDAAELRERVVLLRARVAAEPPPPVQPPPPRRWVAPAVVGALGLALVATAGGLVGSVGPDFDALDRRWQKEGPTADIGQAADALRARETAGWVLLGVGGAVLIVDVALFIVARRRGHVTKLAALEF